MIRKQLKKDIEKAVSRIVGKWDGPLRSEASRVEVTRTSDPKFGDYTTNVALKLANSTLQTANRRKQTAVSGKQSSVEFAKVLAGSLQDLPYVEKLEVAGPGFLNFWIKNEVWQKQVKEVLDSGKKFGSNSLGKDKRARVEFVSANPTGPLHFGNARGGPIGDSLASVLAFCGYKVIREYYHNDIGGQVEKLGQSVLNVSRGQKLEDQEYKGDYISELAGKILSSLSVIPAKAGIHKKDPRVREDDKGELDSMNVGKKMVEILLKEILEDCRDMGITFDQIYPESELATAGSTAEVLKTLGDKKVLKKQEGATWFVPKDEFLKDRECVVVKSDGSFTYFANDIAYHDLKFKDSPDLVIDVWGANHHGHVPRIKAAISALGHDVSRFHVILYQWVRFRWGKEIVKMSKRAGTFVTAREVLDEIGKDALRFFILMHDPNSHIDFDLALAKKKSQENPVYYAQYAHARIASILAKANSTQQIANSSKQKAVSGKQINYNLLATSYELDLIKQITRLPELVEDIATSFAVHRLTAYATELADSFHRFYENCRVIGESRELESARLDLIRATKIALANTLKLLGISAPQKM